MHDKNSSKCRTNASFYFNFTNTDIMIRKLCNPQTTFQFSDNLKTQTANINIPQKAL